MVWTLCLQCQIIQQEEQLMRLGLVEGRNRYVGRIDDRRELASRQVSGSTLRLMVESLRQLNRSIDFLIMRAFRFDLEASMTNSFLNSWSDCKFLGKWIFASCIAK